MTAEGYLDEVLAAYVYRPVQPPVAACAVPGGSKAG